MDSGILIESFAEFAKNKNVDRPTMIRILEDVFRTMIRKKVVVYLKFLPDHGPGRCIQDHDQEEI